ncbi:hypothetical protein [Streptomyces sp. NBC_01643]|nr:hypothetical protein OHB03_02025 [Streptomyces sp. NBC_01643]
MYQPVGSVEEEFAALVGPNIGEIYPHASWPADQIGQSVIGPPQE